MTTIVIGGTAGSRSIRSGVSSPCMLLLKASALLRLVRRRLRGGAVTYGRGCLVTPGIAQCAISNVRLGVGIARVANLLTKVSSASGQLTGA